MRQQEYRAYLQGKNVPGDRIDRQMTVVGNFLCFLTDLGFQGLPTSIGKKEVDQFARRLIAEERNTEESFSALCAYADWIGHRPLYVALIELMDCHNAMEVLAEKIEETHGREVRGRIFQEALPPLGADERERCAHTRIILRRMEQQITPVESREAWFQVQHGIPADVWRRSDLADRETYRQCRDIDDFLAHRRRDRDALLTRLRNEGSLWYTIEINDEVLEFIQRDPEMEGGRREGDRIYITKVPYHPLRYLHESDPVKKRYHACHCPLVREAILQDWPVSADVCECSLGHASHYLAGLGLPLKGQVLESVVRGDTRCRFVFLFRVRMIATREAGGV
jgi:hypothetical protein